MSEITLWGLIGVGLTTAISTSVAFLVNYIGKKHAKKKEDSDAENKKLKQQEADRKLAATVYAVIQPVAQEVKEISVGLKKVSNGTLASLRNDLLDCYHACKEKGYRTQIDSENFRDIYDAYKELGGNSFIDNDIVPAFNQLTLKN